jgi:hypothetical protein
MNLDDLKSTIDQALAGRAEGRAELAAALSTLSIEELACLPPEIWSKLDEGARAEILRRVSRSAPEIPEVVPVSTALPQIGSFSSNSRQIRHWRRLNAMSAPFRGAVAGIATGTMMTVVAAVVVGGYTSAFGWPSENLSLGSGICPRLTPEVDRCTYQIQDVLTWADASARAGIPEAALRRANANHYGPILIAGEKILIVR